MKIIKLHRFLNTIALSLLINCFIINNLCASLNNKIDALLETANRPFNGVILIARGTGPIYERVSGHKGSPQIQSQFIIGSISKQITAVAVMQAVEKGVLDLKTPIRAYLPRLEDQWAEKVTPHHLLNHSSGIDALGKPLAFNPGEKFAYSNLGFDLLGEMLEKVTQKSYKDSVQALFLASEMTSTVVPESGTVADQQKQYPHLLTGFLETDDKRISLAESRREASSNPSGGLISTAYDLLRWNLALHNGKLLTVEMYQKMTTPTSERENRWGKIGYGYGIQISQEDGIIELSHSGIIQGYISTLLYYPKNQISVIILENIVLWTDKWDLEIQKLAFKIHDQVRLFVRGSSLIR